MLGAWAFWAKETPTQRWRRKIGKLESRAELDDWRRWPLPDEALAILDEEEERLIRAEIAAIRKRKGLKPK